MINVVFSISCLLFLVIIANAYFLKSRFNLLENKVYSFLLVTNIIGLTIDIVGFFIFRNPSYSATLKNIIAKFYLIYYFTWCFLLLMYLLIISFKEKFKVNKVRLFITIYLINIIIIYILPIKIQYFDDRSYSYGLAVNYVYFAVFIMILLVAYCLIKNFKRLKNREYIPIFALMVMGTIATIIQNINPEISLLITCHSLITTLMYFTIENPDVKMVEELIANRKLIEQNSEEKSVFFFKMSQGLKEPINNITKEIKAYKNDTNKDVNQIINNIDVNNNKLNYLINDALGINDLLLTDLKKNDNIYNIYTLIKDVQIRGEEYLRKNVQYNVSIPKSMPKELYGDSIRLKQVLMSIVINACNNTNQGFVSFDVTSFSKYDRCRLIFTIEDSGRGIDIKEINEVLNQDEELDSNDMIKLERLDVDLKLSYKIIKALGGTMYIRSEENKGTEVVITIDQYIPQTKQTKENMQIDEYIKSQESNKKILLIDDNEVEIRKIRKYLEHLGYNVTVSMYGQDGIDRIRNKEKYDIILIDDEMPTMSGINVLTEINRLHNKSKKVVLLGSDKLFIAKHYIEDGFDEYIDKTNLIEEFSKKISS